MQGKEFWAVTETSYRAIGGPGDLAEGETLVEGVRPVIPALDNAQKQAELLALAESKISPLQEAVDVDLASDEEKAELLAWKRFRVLVGRVDLRSEKPDWPEVPA